MCNCGYNLWAIVPKPSTNIIRCPQCGEVYIIVTNLFGELEIISVK